MSGFLDPMARLPDVAPAAPAAPSLPMSAPAGAFGPDGSQLERGGAMLERGSDELMSLEEREAAAANQAMVEGAANTFISAKQKALWTDDNAFLRTQGQDAVARSKPVLDQLNDLKGSLLAGMKNDAQRNALTQRLDAQMADATETVGRHTGQESLQWQRQTMAGRQQLITDQAALDSNDSEKLLGLIGAARTTAIEQAGREGHAPDDDYTKAQISIETGKVVTSAIKARIAQNDTRGALQLYDRSQSMPGVKADSALAATMKGLRVNQDGQDLANRALLRQGAPPLPGSDATPDNNTGNIVQSGFQYAGGKGAPKDGFETFQTPEQGVAAAYQTWGAKANANGGQISFLDLIGGNGKVKGWAPRDDGKTPQLKGNDPTAYATQLAASVGLKPTDSVPIGDDDRMATILQTQNRIEKGRQTVPDQAFAGGIQLARMGTPTGGAAFKGDLKGSFDAAALEIQKGPEPDDVKRTAVALLNRQRTEITGLQSASVKSLTDEARSTLTAAYVNPDGLKPGTFAAYADRAASLGEQELATRYKLLATLEPTIKQGLAMARPDQIQMLKSLSDGLPKQLLEGLRSNDPEALQGANDQFAKLKQRQADNLPITPADVTPVLKAYGDLGRSEKVREVQEWGTAALQAGELGKRPKAEQDQAMAELQGVAGKGQMTEQQATLYHLLKEGIAHQDAGFRDDAFSTGTQILGLPVQPLAFKDSDALGQQLRQRGTYVTQIRNLRPDADVVPFTNDELGQMRDYLAKGNSEGAVKLYQSLSAMPRDLQLATAARLNGKGKSDDLSQMYAAGMAAFPGNPQAAQEIVRGADILKNAGDSQKKLAATSPAFQTALSDQIGNALTLYTGTEMPSEIVNAAKAVYAWRAQAAGKQYDPTPDADLLRQSIDAVTGGVIDYRGQKIFAPRAGMSHYDVDTALSTLRNDDLPAGLKSGEGTPITADMIARKGVLYSFGDDQYVVKLPDRGGVLKPIEDPRHPGNAWTMPFRPLLDRRSDAPVTPLGSTMPAPKQGQRFLQGWALPQ